MAKGSVRKKGKKWYYRFYVEDESGDRMQKEFPGAESKSETESLLRKAMEDYLRKKGNPALLPIQIAYYTGLRIGEVCGLTWQDINLEEQYLTVRRSIRYNAKRHKTEIGPTKRRRRARWISATR